MCMRMYDTFEQGYYCWQTKEQRKKEQPLLDAYTLAIVAGEFSFRAGGQLDRLHLFISNRVMLIWWHIAMIWSGGFHPGLFHPGVALVISNTRKVNAVNTLKKRANKERKLWANLKVERPQGKSWLPHFLGPSCRTTPRRECWSCNKGPRTSVPGTLAAHPRWWCSDTPFKNYFSLTSFKGFLCVCQMLLVKDGELTEAPDSDFPDRSWNFAEGTKIGNLNMSWVIAIISPRMFRRLYCSQGLWPWGSPNPPKSTEFKHYSNGKSNFRGAIWTCSIMQL